MRLTSLSILSRRAFAAAVLAPNVSNAIASCLRCIRITTRLAVSSLRSRSPSIRCCSFSTSLLFRAPHISHIIGSRASISFGHRHPSHSNVSIFTHDSSSSCISDISLSSPMIRRSRSFRSDDRLRSITSSSHCSNASTTAGVRHRPIARATIIRF